MNTIAIEKLSLDGIKKISSPSWDGELFEMSRSSYLKFKSHKLFLQPGVYIIYADHFNKQDYGHHIYIGQGDPVGARLASHVADKKFWNKVLFLTSEWMNIAHAFNIEDEFIKSAKIASRYAVDNSISGQPKQLGANDRQRCNDYIKGAKHAIELANIDIFTANVDGYFYYKDYLTNAKLIVVNSDRDLVKVTANSKIYCPSGCSDAANLLAAGKVKEESVNFYLFQEDVELQIDRSGIVPKVFGASASKFENGCGISVVSVISSIKCGQIQHPPQ